MFFPLQDKSAITKAWADAGGETPKRFMGLQYCAPLLWSIVIVIQDAPAKGMLITRQLTARQFT